MTKFSRKHKIIAAVSGVGLAIAAGGTAFAYYLLGTGEGSVSTEAFAGVNIDQLGDIDELVPDIPSKVTLEVTNNTSGPITVGYIDISFPDGWHEGDCTPEDFDLTDHVLVNHTIPEDGGGITVVGHITLTNNPHKDQTDCLGLTDIPLIFTAHND
jgi:hypothetical protein